jgi:hypothetical protein
MVLGSNIRTTINIRMKSLQDAMENNAHLINPDEVDNLIDGIAKFWSALSFDDREYVMCVRDAVESQTKWNI